MFGGLFSSVFEHPQIPCAERRIHAAKVQVDEVFARTAYETTDKLALAGVLEFRLRFLGAYAHIRIFVVVWVVSDIAVSRIRSPAGRILFPQGARLARVHFALLHLQDAAVR